MHKCQFYFYSKTRHTQINENIFFHISLSRDFSPEKNDLYLYISNKIQKLRYLMNSFDQHVSLLDLNEHAPIHSK